MPEREGNNILPMIRTLSYGFAEIEGYIDWSYFFHAWGFARKYSRAADLRGGVQAWINGFAAGSERDCAEEAVKLYGDARKLLAECGGRYKAFAKFGIFEANSRDDDIIISLDNGEEALIPCLRQQRAAPDDGVCLCLADFIRPAGQNIKDRIGLFASTVEGGFENQPEDDAYMRMLRQTLADRLAEAAAELTHLRIRKTYWGYTKDESLAAPQLFSGRYQGIRPAVGYPSLPDQSVIFMLDAILNMSDIGISITGIGAMIPHASTCGLIIANPAARHFSVGRISRAQADDYARRRGLPKEEVYRFLRSNLQL